MTDTTSIFRRYVAGKDGAVHVRVGGRGRPVVLVPDSPGSGVALVPLARTLVAHGFAVAVPDLAGAGGTTLPWEGGLTDQARVVATTIEGLGWGPALVVGDGVGAAVAARLATDRPDLVDGPVHVLSEPYAGEERTPDLDFTVATDGTHFLRLWHDLREAHIFSPFWVRSAATRRARSMPTPLELNEIFADTLAAPGAHRALAEEARLAWADLAAGLAQPPVPVGADPAATLAAAPAPEGGAAHVVEAAEGRLPVAAGAITRDYVRVPHGQMHVRLAGAPSEHTPVLLLHASPGSAEGLEELAVHLGTDRLVVAVDMPGHGRSDRLPADQPQPVTLASYAPIMVDVMSALGIPTFDAYGSHTGAGLAAEVAIAAPDRVRRIVFDGMPLFDDRPELVASVADNYFVDLTPDLHGSHLVRAWGMQTDMYMWWPWYEQVPATARTNEPSPLSKTHASITELARSAPVYETYYRAAWAWPCTQRIPHVPHRSLVATIPTDSLRAMTALSVELLPDAEGSLFTLAYDVRAEEVRAFLDAD